MPGAVAAEPTIPIGICQSTAQGPAKFATALLKGAQLSVDTFNAAGGAKGRKIEIIPLDIGNNDPSQARLSFTKGIEVDKIVALICWGTNVMAQNGPIVDGAGVAAFAMSQGLNVPKKSKFTQQLEAITTMQCRVTAKYTKENFPNVKRLAVLYVNYEFGIEIRDQCQIEFGKVGIEMVASEGHPNAPTDLRAQTTKLLEAKPDAIFLAPIGGGTIPLGIRAGRELGYTGLYMTTSAGDTSDVYTFKLAEKDFFFVAHDIPASAPAALKDVAAAYGGYAAAGYEYGWLVGKLANDLTAAGQPVNGQGIIDKIRGVNTVETPLNTYVFKKDGDTVRPLGIFGVNGGARKLLKAYSAKDLAE
ncbi:amino acid ABC transporter substrate-binding protein [Bradyrhizobium lablabi]|uniref:ABC transporter substrate-binding protein n=1 Tax=Bradyrhizobium lablabi TaxID=722472 RepID=UPI001BAA112C|nr:ABC transporter substrate-binding protein [Bradyrhizobium lablabi]MBR1121020.1 amino acid ABC transporter substrate-binding protein [Bradyrhizobium lablabi]